MLRKLLFAWNNNLTSDIHLIPLTFWLFLGFHDNRDYQCGLRFMDPTDGAGLHLWFDNDSLAPPCGEPPTWRTTVWELFALTFLKPHQGIRHHSQSWPTTAPDGGQQPTDHTICWRGIHDPGQHLYGNQGREVLQHWISYCSLEEIKGKNNSNISLYLHRQLWRGIRCFVWSPESWLWLVWRRWDPERSHTPQSHPPGWEHTEVMGRFHLLTGCSGTEGTLTLSKTSTNIPERNMTVLHITDKWRLRHQRDFALSCTLHLPENPLHLHLGQKTICHETTAQFWTKM